MCLTWPCASEAVSLLCKFVFAFQYNPICGDIHSESRHGNKHNTSLHLWPPCSSSSLWMQCNNEGEQGRGRKIPSLFRYLLMVHKLKDSRFSSDNKSVRKPTCKMLRKGFFKQRQFSLWLQKELWLKCRLCHSHSHKLYSVLILVTLVILYMCVYISPKPQKGSTDAEMVETTRICIFFSFFLCKRFPHRHVEKLTDLEQWWKKKNSDNEYVHSPVQNTSKKDREAFNFFLKLFYTKWCSAEHLMQVKVKKLAVEADKSQTCI